MPYEPYTNRPRLKRRNGPGAKIVLLLIAAFAVATAGSIAALIAALS